MSSSPLLHFDGTRTSFLEHLPSGFLAMGQNNQVMWANHRAVELFGDQDLVGHNLLGLFGPANQKALTDLISELRHLSESRFSADSVSADSVSADSVSADSVSASEIAPPSVADSHSLDSESLASDYGNPNDANSMGDLATRPKIVDLPVGNRQDVERITRLHLVGLASPHGSLGVLITPYGRSHASISPIVRDGLTGLPTREVLIDRCRVALSSLEDAGGCVGLVFIDLDGMKRVNDRLGHDAGDQFLCDIAARLRATVRDRDTVSRFGGDEFVVLVPDATNERELTYVVQRIWGVITQPLVSFGERIAASASIGVSFATTSSATAELLVRDADTAMYVGKRAGGGIVTWFDDELRRITDDRRELQSELRMAIANHSLDVRYQPIVSLDGGIVGAEALVRWRHPILGELGPGQFIPMAEECGLIHGLGLEVLEVAARSALHLRRFPGLENFYVSVNVSAEQLRQRDFPTAVEAAVERVGAKPNMVVLEVTETSLVRDPLDAQRTLRTLSDKGFDIALDDFGTGYSSIRHLHDFPVSILKIDQSFIGNLQSSRRDRAIVAALIGLATALDITVCAEGVTSTAEVEILRMSGCGLAQGFLWAPAISEMGVIAMAGAS